MNRIHAITLSAAIALAAATTLAQEHQHSEPQAAPGGAPADGKGGMGMMDGRMHEHMKTMREQMARIRGAADAGERDKLVQEHMRSMHTAMEMMRGMQGPMMDGHKSGAGARGSGAAQKQQDMMAHCMGMMQKARPGSDGHEKHH